MLWLLGCTHTWRFSTRPRRSSATVQVAHETGLRLRGLKMHAGARGRGQGGMCCSSEGWALPVRVLPAAGP